MMYEEMWFTIRIRDIYTRSLVEPQISSPLTGILRPARPRTSTCIYSGCIMHVSLMHIFMMQVQCTLSISNHAYIFWPPGCDGCVLDANIYAHICMTLIPDPDAYSYAANFVTDQQTTNKGILGLGFFWKHLDSCSHIDRHGCTPSRGEEHSWTILSKFGATWKADGCHNWADPSQHLMLFWRSGVYCHFRAIPAAVYLAATVQVIHHSLLGLVELYNVQHTKGQYRGSSEAPENRCSISWSNLVQLYFHEFALYNTSSMHPSQCPGGSIWAQSLTAAVTICITAQRAAGGPGTRR